MADTKDSQEPSLERILSSSDCVVTRKVNTWKYMQGTDTSRIDHSFTHEIPKNNEGRTSFIQALLQHRIGGYSDNSQTPFAWCKSHVRDFAQTLQDLLMTSEERAIEEIASTIKDLFNAALNHGRAPWNYERQNYDPKLSRNIVLQPHADNTIHFIPVTPSGD